MIRQWNFLNQYSALVPSWDTVAVIADIDSSNLIMDS